MKTAVIFTDGSCNNTEKGGWSGGWAALILSGEGICILTGAEKKTTSNRMEVTAAIQAMRELTVPHFIFLVSDSTYLLDTIKRETTTKRSVNADLWKDFGWALLKHNIFPIKIQGHGHSQFNNLAHELANYARIHQKGERTFLHINDSPS